MSNSWRLSPYGKSQVETAIKEHPKNQSKIIAELGIGPSTFYKFKKPEPVSKDIFIQISEYFGLQPEKLRECEQGGITKLILWYEKQYDNGFKLPILATRDIHPESKAEGIKEISLPNLVQSLKLFVTIEKIQNNEKFKIQFQLSPYETDEMLNSSITMSLLNKNGKPQNLNVTSNDDDKLIQFPRSLMCEKGKQFIISLMYELESVQERFEV